MTTILIAAWLIPLAAGAGLWLALDPVRRPGWIASMLGQGAMAGLFLAGGATALFARADTAHALAHAGPWLAAFALGAAVLAWWRRRAAPPALPATKASACTIALIAAALLSLAWRAYLMLREILLRPTYPWDAWDAWAVKSKTWFLLGHYVPFVSIQDWLAHPDQELYTSVAWAYPSLLPWMQVWFASAAGGWIEPLVNLPWFAAWAGMLLGHYGQWRALGVARRPALVGMYALGSLPLMNVHVALAGYADLWLAAVLGFATLAWLRWLQDREPVQLGVAVACALLLPLLKLEGAIWLLLFAAAMAYGFVPLRWRRRLWLAAFGVAMLAALFGALRIPLPGLGWVKFNGHTLSVQSYGDFTIGWHGAAFVSVLQSLFVQLNWHLLWWVAPLIVIWRRRELMASEPLLRVGSLLLAGIAFLMFLFLFTDAAHWAERYTAVNRLVMHLVPALISFLVLLLKGVNWRRVFRDTPSRFVPHSDPA